MRSTARLLAAPGFPGFWTRSLTEFKRLSNIAIKLEGLHKPEGHLEIWNFSQPSSVQACTDMSDSDIGGHSSSKLQHIPQSKTEPGHALFIGHISNKLPSDEEDVQRTGYAAFRTRDRPATLFGKQLWNVEQFAYLALRVKSDGRKYKINIQTESIVYTDIHQHRLYARSSGTWETVLIRWRDFVRTNHGIVVEPQSEMRRDKVRTIGIGLTDRLAGPFEMRVAHIWATNGLTKEELGGSDAEAKDVHYIPKTLLDGSVPTQAHSQRLE